MTRIAVSSSIGVSYQEISEILDIMNDCYERLKPHETILVDLKLFKSVSQTEAYLSSEYASMGVASDRFDHRFFALHHAWRGIPTITICLERMKEIPLIVKTAGIRHEVGHSIIHGELRHYHLNVPTAYREAMQIYRLKRDFIVNLTYLTSIAVKDYEVTKLLYEHGYVQDQVEYVECLLINTEEDIIAWRLAQTEPHNKVQYLVACLKIPFCASPLLADNMFGKKVEKSLVESLDYLGSWRDSVIKTILEANTKMVQDTTENIAIAAEFITSSILQPLLADHNRSS